jgi:hypothetical protein
VLNLHHATFGGSACLIKFAHAQDCFVCDFDTFLKMCCANLYMYLIWRKNTFMNIFKAFFEFHEGIFDQLLAASGQILQQTSNL